MHRRAAIVVSSLVGVFACSAFDPDDAAPGGGSGAADADAAGASGGGSSEDAGAPLDASPDVAAAPSVDCASRPAVDFCSDFEDGQLPGPWGEIVGTSALLAIAPAGAGKALQVALPSDSNPATAYLAHDAATAATVAFGFDLAPPPWTAGDYVEAFALEAPNPSAFAIKITLGADGALEAHGTSGRLASLGTIPKAPTRIEGVVVFTPSSTQIALKRDGTEIAVPPGPAVLPRPPLLRLRAGMIYAEASGGGALRLDNVVFDRLP